MRRVSICIVALVFGTVCLALPPEAADWRPPLTRQHDFYSFWSSATYQTSVAQRPSAGEPDMLSLFASRPSQSSAIRLQLPSNPDLPIPILHLSDRHAPSRSLAGLEGSVMLQQRLVFDNEAHTAYALEGLPDIHACKMAQGVTAARTALYRLLSHPDADHARAGIIGEGVGASVGLALSVLEPDLVAFVACHEPLPAFHILPDGTVADSPAVREAIQNLPSRVRADSDVLRKSLSYFDFYNFAPEVRRPTLVSMSVDDEVATPEQVLALHNRLACPKRLEMIEDPIHLGHQGRSEFLRRCANWIANSGLDEPPAQTSPGTSGGPRYNRPQDVAGPARRVYPMSRVYPMQR